MFNQVVGTIKTEFSGPTQIWDGLFRTPVKQGDHSTIVISLCHTIIERKGFRKSLFGLFEAPLCSQHTTFIVIQIGRFRLQLQGLIEQLQRFGGLIRRQ